jgi:hypothetical protein
MISPSTDDYLPLATIDVGTITFLDAGATYIAPPISITGLLNDAKVQTILRLVDGDVHVMCIESTTKWADSTTAAVCIRRRKCPYFCFGLFKT